MSEKDFDWNDDLDFESLADEKEMEADYGEPDDGFGDFEDLADYADPPAKETAAPEEVREEPVIEAAEPAPAPVIETRSPESLQGRPQKLISSGGLGFLMMVGTFVGAVGMGGAMLLASGFDPRSLLDLSGFMALDRILDFRAHPVNVVYLVTAGLLLVALCGAAIAGRQARQANACYQENQNLLERITALRLDDEMPWTSDYFKEDPDAAAFVSDILGAWRLQQARQVKSVGLEGELRRLEKALRDDSRSDLADRYDHPLVGSLADAMVGWYDDRDAARKETAAIREKDELETGEIMSLIQDSRSWNHANRDKVEVQGATLKRWARRFEEMVNDLETESGQNEAVAALQGLQKDLAREVDRADAAGLASLDDLVDRGSKLAFQIAMEVARLGPRGERLLPMSQSLEELTTQFRQTVAKTKNEEDSEATNPQAVMTRLEQVTVQLVKQGSGGSQHLARSLRDLGPASLKLAENLDEITHGFGQQSTRLNNLGTSFAGLTGLEFDANDLVEEEPSNPPEGGLNIAQNDPFGKETAVEPVAPTLEVDPFGGTENEAPAQELPLAETGITTDITPGQEDAFGSLELERSEDFRPEPDPEPVIEQPADSLVTERADSGGLTSDQPLVAETDPGLPVQEERVYDLNEFGAVRVDADGAEDEDRIYELAEFGAVALT